MYRCVGRNISKLLLILLTIPGFFWSSHPFQVFVMLGTIKGIWHRGLSLIAQTSCHELHLGPLEGKKGMNRQIIPNCYHKHTIFISFIYIVSSLFFPTFSQKSTTTCWCKKTGQQFLVTCTLRQAPTVHKDSPKSCKWAAKSMGSACPSLGTDTGFGLLSPRDFLTSSAFFRQHYKELQMGIEKKKYIRLKLHVI